MLTGTTTTVPSHEAAAVLAGLCCATDMYQDTCKTHGLEETDLYGLLHRCQLAGWQLGRDVSCKTAAQPGCQLCSSQGQATAGADETMGKNIKHESSLALQRQNWWCPEETSSSIQQHSAWKGRMHPSGLDHTTPSTHQRNPWLRLPEAEYCAICARRQPFPQEDAENTDHCP